jgi:TorA maturation chaperone TorD
MPDPGFQEAIRAAGGVSALARLTGISERTLREWERVPPAQVLVVEAATGVARAVLRPDLFDAESSEHPDDEIARARAQEYGLLSTLLARSPDAAMIGRLARLRGDASPLGVAHAALGEVAARASAEQVAQEYFDLFYGLGRGGLLPYASYYLTGSLYGRPLAQLRETLQRLGIERPEGSSEPEDHAAVLLEIMAGLADCRIAALAGADREIFDKHLAPWIGRFFVDLAQA